MYVQQHLNQFLLQDRAILNILVILSLKKLKRRLVHALELCSCKLRCVLDPLFERSIKSVWLHI